MARALLLLLACQACLTRAAVLKVGVVIESSGGWQAGRDAHTGIELAKEDFLRAGTTLGNWAIAGGHSMTLVGASTDTSCSASISQGHAATIYSTSVHGQIGPGCSTSSVPVASLSQYFKVPMITHASQAISLEDASKFPYFFRMATNAKISMSALATYANSKGFLQVAVIVEDEKFFKDMAGCFMNKLVHEFGGFSAAEEAFSLNPKSVAASVRRVEDSTAVAILTGSYVKGSELLFTHCGKLCSAGYVWLSTSNNMDSFDSLSSTAKFNMLGLFAANAGFPDSQKTTTLLEGRYLAKLRAGGPSRVADPSLQLGGKNIFGLFAYDGVMALAWAWKAVQDGVAADMHTALRTGVVDFEGMTGRVKFRVDTNDVYEQVTIIYNLQGDATWQIASHYAGKGCNAGSEFKCIEETLVDSKNLVPLFAGKTATPPAKRECQPGYFAESSFKCTACPVPFFNSRPGQTSCSYCGSGILSSARDECRPCPTVRDGYRYLFNPNLCKSGKVQPEALQLQKPAKDLNDTAKHIISLWWDDTPGANVTSVYTCPYANCFFAPVPEKSVSPDIDFQNLSVYQRWCSEGHMGVLCSQCLDGYFLAAGGCLRCPEGEAFVVWDYMLLYFTMVGFTMICITAAGLHWKSVVEQAPPDEEDVLSDQDGVIEIVPGTNETLAQRLAKDLAKQEKEKVEKVFKKEIAKMNCDGNAALKKDAQADLQKQSTGAPGGSKWSKVRSIIGNPKKLRAKAIHIFREHAKAALAKFRDIIGNKMKILLSYIQVINLFRFEMGGLVFPDFAVSMFSGLDFLSFAIFDISPIGCASDATKPFELQFILYVYVLLGSVLVVSVFAVMVVGPCMFKRRQDRVLWNAEIYKWTGITCFLFYTQVTRIIVLAIRPCIKELNGWIAFIVFCIGLPAGFAAIIYLSRRSLYCYAIEADVDECGSFVGNAQSQLQRYSCGTVLKMHAALDCAVVPLDGIPYTLLEVTNDDDGNEEMTEFVFTAGLVMVREKDDDNEVAAVQLGFGWMAGKYDSIAWWFEPWEFVRKLILICTAVFAASDQTVQVVFALVVCILCLMFQSEVQPFVDAEDDFLSVVSSSSLAMTLAVGLALKVPVADPTTQWMLNWMAIAVCSFVFFLALYQAIVDAYETCCKQAKTAREYSDLATGTSQVAAEPEELEVEPRPEEITQVLRLEDAEDNGDELQMAAAMATDAAVQEEMVLGTAIGVEIEAQLDAGMILTRLLKQRAVKAFKERQVAVPGASRNSISLGL